MKNLPKPPSDLSKEAKKFWKSLQKEYGITDTAGIHLLTDAARFFDRREEARQILKKDGCTIQDRFGQTIAHPATRIERDSSAAMLRCLKALNLDLEPLHSKAGRPPGV